MNAGEGAPASRNRRVATATCLGLVLTAAAAYWYWAQGPVPASARPPARAAVPVSVAVVERQDVPTYLTGLGTVQASFTIGIHSQVAPRKLREGIFAAASTRAGSTPMATT